MVLRTARRTTVELGDVRADFLQVYLQREERIRDAMQWESAVLSRELTIHSQTWSRFSRKKMREAYRSVKKAYMQGVN